MGILTRLLELGLSDTESRSDRLYRHSDRRRRSSSSRSYSSPRTQYQSDYNSGSPSSYRSTRNQAARPPYPNSKSNFPMFTNTSELKAQVDDLRHDLSRAQRKLSKQRRKNTERTQEINKLRSELNKTKRLCESRRDIIDEHKDKLSDLRRTLRQRDDEIDEKRIAMQDLQQTVLYNTRQVIETSAAREADAARHRADVSRLRRLTDEREARRDSLMQKLASDQRESENKCTNLETNWHTIKRAEDALAVAVQFQEQLAKHSYMRWRGPESDSPVPEGKSVVFCQMDRCSFRVPLMAHFLPWSATPKTCGICANDYHELDIIDQDHWRQACKGFEGPWMKEILSFPDPEDLHCDHPMDVCKSCIQFQIHTQLETLGSKGWDKLSCPCCARLLSNAEVQRFASKEDFEKYERFYVVEYLSKEPGFRWCLSGSCTSGQLYEQTRFMHLNPLIKCKACNFAMCFQHQEPWHANETCAEHDRKKIHGAEELKSEAWKKENTKPCPGPGCGKPILKGEGCFHMTCFQCRYEFCWECLADWNTVRTNKNNHKEGCYFRTSTVGPMGMRGTTINAALGRTL